MSRINQDIYLFAIRKLSLTERFEMTKDWKLLYLKMHSRFRADCHGLGPIIFLDKKWKSKFEKKNASNEQREIKTQN